LRRFPVIQDPRDGAYIAPLPQLVVYRMTAGLYYDFADAPQALLEEANTRFEEYAQRLIEAYFPRFTALPSQSYGPRKHRRATPDVLVQDGGQISIVIECKATKLTHEAQFADNPFEAAKSAHAQIVKGIAQLWRFFCHARQGLYDGPPVSPEAHAVLLTMDAWMQMSRQQRERALAAARELVRDEPGFADEDARPVVFCSMQELADVMIVSDDADHLLKTLEAAVSEQYAGWGFREVRRDLGVPQVARAFPFDVAELVPWWEIFQTTD
tara:strand:- start:16 stop:822 length:807 start_codon:yes stop_codon:yes gene_type:complete